MKVRFTTLGCKLNFAESSALGKELLSRGHQRASLNEVPDVCVVNTCSVTDAADHKDRQTINQLHRKYPNAIIIVTGCYAQLQPEQIAQIPGVDYVLGQNEKYDIPALVDTLESQLPHNTTPPLHHTTQLPHHATQPPHNATPPPHHATPPPHHATPPLHHATPPLHNATQPPHNTTPPLHNATPPPHHATQLPHHTTPLLHHSTQLLHHSTPPLHHSTPHIHVCAIREVEEFHGVHSGDDRTRCFIKVQDGCNYFCTYCTIPYARGKSRNPKIEEVVRTAQQAIDQGAKELILTGVNIGDFGRTTGERFIDLLRALDHLSPHASTYRIRISSCEPNLLTDEVIDFVANSKHFAPHFHIPLQSGSNEVLQIMKRRYTRELFAERVQHIKSVMPHAFIGVDCMVGVRGETQEYWEDYLAFVRSLDVSQLHVFTYSERANTRMLEMDLYVVPKSERQRRSKILHEVSEQKTRDFYAKHANRPALVLWESKREGDQMSGFTDNYIKVYRPYDKTKINTFELV